MFHALVVGIVLGLAAGVTPGPLQALVISQSALFGWRRGALTALAPLITDAAIVIATVWLFSHMPNWVLHAMTIAGALLVGYIAYGTWLTLPAANTAAVAETAPAAAGDVTVSAPAATGDVTVSAPSGATIAPTTAVRTARRHDLVHATLINLGNPHAWLFWLVVGAPLTVKFARVADVEAGAFIVGFYLLLVGVKVLLAGAIDRGVTWTGSRGQRWILIGTSAALAILAIVMLATGIRGLV